MSSKQPKQGKPTTDNTHDLFAVRMEKLKTMEAEGKSPFFANCEQSHTSTQAVALYEEGSEEQPTVKVAGRIVVFRVMVKQASSKSSTATDAYKPM